MLALILALLVALPGPDFAGLRHAWESSLRTRHLDASVALYAPDSVFVLADGSRHQGRNAIRMLYGGAMRMYLSDLHFHSLASYAAGDLAYDSGHWTETLTLRSSGKIKKSTGSYMTVYRYINDRWLIVEQVWTSPDRD
jgi:ketosteroid isomerase-like protein